MVLLSLASDTSASSALATHLPDDAIDGSGMTRWAATSSDEQEWWQADLGALHRIVEVRTRWLHRSRRRKRIRTGTANVYSYVIEGSVDGTEWQPLADRNGPPSFCYTIDELDTVVRYVRIDVLRATKGNLGIRECSIIGDPAVAEVPATPAITAQSNRLIMTADDVATVRSLVATPGTAETAAWSYFRDGKVAAAMAAAPNVDPGPTVAFTYTKLDTDSRHARNLAVAYATNGAIDYAEKAAQFVVAWAKGNTPAPYSFTGDTQGGYHQSYGAFSFAFAYDLTRDAGVYSETDHTAIKAWFRTWASVMKGYQDNWATDWVFSQAADGDWRPYEWTVNPLGLEYSRYDQYMGSDATLAPMAAWLAAAIVSDDSASITTLFSSTYKLNVPECLHRSSAPRNDGDGRGTARVPEALIKSKGYYDNAERGGNLDYMSYNARLASMVYEMTANLGRATSTMRSELNASWSYLSKFAGPNYEAPVAPNDLMHWDLFLSRMQIGLHIYNDAALLADVSGGQYPRSQFYESQFLGPTTLTQPTAL